MPSRASSSVDLILAVSCGLTLQNENIVQVSYKFYISEHRFFNRIVQNTNKAPHQELQYWHEIQEFLRETYLSEIKWNTFIY